MYPGLDGLYRRLCCFSDQQAAKVLALEKGTVLSVGLMLSRVKFHPERSWEVLQELLDQSKSMQAVHYTNMK